MSTFEVTPSCVTQTSTFPSPVTFSRRWWVWLPVTLMRDSSLKCHSGSVLPFVS